VNATGRLFEVADAVLTWRVESVPSPMGSRSEQDLTPVAGVALWGPLLDRLNLVAEADRRGLRPIGPGGRGRARGGPAHDRPGRHPGGGLRPGQAPSTALATLLGVWGRVLRRHAGPSQCHAHLLPTRRRTQTFFCRFFQLTPEHPGDSTGKCSARLSAHGAGGLPAWEMSSVPVGNFCPEMATRPVCSVHEGETPDAHRHNQHRWSNAATVAKPGKGARPSKAKPGEGTA
jgi:hypothetical protein